MRKKRFSVDMKNEQAQTRTTAQREHELYGGTLKGSELLRGHNILPSRMGNTSAQSINKDVSVLN